MQEVAFNTDQYPHHLTLGASFLVVQQSEDQLEGDTNKLRCEWRNISCVVS